MDRPGLLAGKTMAVTATAQSKPLSGKVALVAGATRRLAGHCRGAGARRGGGPCDGEKQPGCRPVGGRRPETIDLSTGQLAPICGFTDTDGTQPDCWRYVVEVQDKGLPADHHGYRVTRPGPRGD